MADSSHSATTVPSGPGPANFQTDRDIAGPFLLNIRKPLSTSEYKDLRQQPGLLRKSFPGNPVLVGHIGLPNHRRFCVTGDTGNQNNMTLSVQPQDERGVAIPDYEILKEGWDFLRGQTQAGIMRMLEVDSTMWVRRIKTNNDIEMLELTNKRFGNDPSLVRDSFPGLFRIAITAYVVQKIKAAREQERREFLALRRAWRPRDIYSQCGWLDLADIGLEKWLEELRKSMHGATPLAWR